MASSPPRRLLVACAVFERELDALVGASAAPVELVLLPQGLHNAGAEGMRAGVQEGIARADPGRHAAVLLAWGLCGRGLSGVKAPGVPLVVPRAHDCISILLGDRGRHEALVRAHPGTYWRSCGWIEKAGPPDTAAQLPLDGLPGTPYSWAELMAKFGEEDAREIAATLSSHAAAYDRISFIRTGAEPDGSLLERARAEARSLGWGFETVAGDLGWLGRLVTGPWDEREFLIVPPGHRITQAWDGSLIGAEPR